MSQGLDFAISVDGASFNFKSLSVRETSTSVDRTSKFNRDGTVNEGYSDTAGDIGTLHLTCDEIIGGEDMIAWIGYFEAGGEYTDKLVVISYSDITIYTMDGFYVDDVESTGSIPGEARARFSIHSIGKYLKGP